MPVIHEHAVMPRPNHDELAEENFTRALAVKLETRLRPRLRGIFESTVKPAFVTREGREPTAREIAKDMRKVNANRMWYRLRTDNQDRMYQVSSAMIERQLDELAATAKAVSGKLGSLTLNPGLDIPGYLSEIDIHRKPGGYHTEFTADDVAAGAQYDRTISVHNMGSQGPHNDDPGVTLAAWIRQRFPALKPKRILDMGCTIGNNTLPYATAWPDAEVHGIDCSAPCVRYAHARANALGVAAHFHQMNAEATTFSDASFDLVVSRILLHETSRAALPNIFRECHRLLRPGGVMLHCDAPQFDEMDAYQASLRDWDATCNNEPFMLTVYALPLEDMYVAAGFAKADTFRGTAPSLFFQQRNPDPNATRSGGRYFFTGAEKAGALNR
ncbi:MAG: methyltransferase domain-containing protein [Rhodospirillaceae bacterium]|nr:methyltransferase domain-containing protein [Rhodospirillaceae bacterium]